MGGEGGVRREGGGEVEREIRGEGRGEEEVERKRRRGIATVLLCPQSKQKRYNL